MVDASDRKDVAGLASCRPRGGGEDSRGGRGGGAPRAPAGALVGFVGEGGSQLSCEPRRVMTGGATLVPICLLSPMAGVVIGVPERSAG
jgi:hypothetical protein